MKKKTPALSLVVLVVLAALYVWENRDSFKQGRDQPPTRSDADRADGAIERAFRQKRSKVWVEATGTVAKVLPDDRIPPRHQQFIVRLASGHTVKIAHNVDLAPAVTGLGEGQAIAFRGRYEYEARGGVVHWTHHDPDGRRPGGWLEIGGKRYE